MISIGVKLSHAQAFVSTSHFHLPPSPVSCKTKAADLPGGFAQLAWPVADVLSVHFPQGFGAFHSIREAHKAIPCRQAQSSIGCLQYSVDAVHMSSATRSRWVENVPCLQVCRREQEDPSVHCVR